MTGDDEVGMSGCPSNEFARGVIFSSKPAQGVISKTFKPRSRHRIECWKILSGEGLTL